MKKIFILLFLLFTLSNNSHVVCMENTKHIWTPQTVTVTAVTLYGIKLIHDGFQKIFNPNKRQFSISNSTWFSGKQGGSNVQRTQTFELHAPKATRIPRKITINFKRLTRQEEDAEFYQGATMLSIGLMVTGGGMWYLYQQS